MGNQQIKISDINSETEFQTTRSTVFLKTSESSLTLSCHEIPCDDNNNHSTLHSTPQGKKNREKTDSQIKISKAREKKCTKDNNKAPDSDCQSDIVNEKKAEKRAKSKTRKSSQCSGDDEIDRGSNSARRKTKKNSLTISLPSVVCNKLRNCEIPGDFANAKVTCERLDDLVTISLPLTLTISPKDPTTKLPPLSIKTIKAKPKLSSTSNAISTKSRQHSPKSQESKNNKAVSPPSRKKEEINLEGKSSETKKTNSKNTHRDKSPKRDTSINRVENKLNDVTISMSETGLTKIKKVKKSENIVSDCEPVVPKKSNNVTASKVKRKSVDEFNSDLKNIITNKLPDISNREDEPRKTSSSITINHSQKAKPCTQSSSRKIYKKDSQYNWQNFNVESQKYYVPPSILNLQNAIETSDQDILSKWKKTYAEAQQLLDATFTPVVKFRKPTGKYNRELDNKWDKSYEEQKLHTSSSPVNDTETLRKEFQSKRKTNYEEPQEITNKSLSKRPFSQECTRKISKQESTTVNNSARSTKSLNKETTSKISKEELQNKWMKINEVIKRNLANKKSTRTFNDETPRDITKEEFQREWERTQEDLQKMLSPVITEIIHKKLSRDFTKHVSKQELKGKRKKTEDEPHRMLDATPTVNQFYRTGSQNFIKKISKQELQGKRTKTQDEPYGWINISPPPVNQTYRTVSQNFIKKISKQELQSKKVKKQEPYRSDILRPPVNLSSRTFSQMSTKKISKQDLQCRKTRLQETYRMLYDSPSPAHFSSRSCSQNSTKKISKQDLPCKRAKTQELYRVSNMLSSPGSQSARALSQNSTKKISKQELLSKREKIQEHQRILDDSPSPLLWRVVPSRSRSRSSTRKLPQKYPKELQKINVSPIQTNLNRKPTKIESARKITNQKSQSNWSKRREEPQKKNASTSPFSKSPPTKSHSRHSTIKVPKQKSQIKVKHDNKCDGNTRVVSWLSSQVNSDITKSPKKRDTKVMKEVPAPTTLETVSNFPSGNFTTTTDDNQNDQDDDFSLEEEHWSCNYLKRDCSPNHNVLLQANKKEM